MRGLFIKRLFKTIKKHVDIEIYKILFNNDMLGRLITQTRLYFYIIIKGIIYNI